MLEQEFRDRNGVFVAALRDDGSLYVRRSVLDSGVVDAVVAACLGQRCPSSRAAERSSTAPRLSTSRVLLSTYME